MQKNIAADIANTFFNNAIKFSDKNAQNSPTEQALIFQLGKALTTDQAMPQRVRNHAGRLLSDLLKCLSPEITVNPEPANTPSGFEPSYLDQLISIAAVFDQYPAANVKTKAAKTCLYELHALLTPYSA